MGSSDRHRDSAGAVDRTMRRGSDHRPLSRDVGGDSRAAELATSIPAHQQAISSHEGAMLREIAEFDRAESWRGDGSLSMRDWLVAQCRISRSRARCLVDSARRAEQLPALSQALAEGRLTLDVFAPLARVATPGSDAPLAHRARFWSPRQAQQLVAELEGSSDAEAAAQLRRRFVHFDDRRRMLWAQLSGDAYALVKSAIVGQARRHDHPSAGDDGYVPFDARCADALLDVSIAAGRRRGSSGTGAGHGGGRTTMVVHTDLERLLHGDGYGHASIQGVGPISAEVARRLACNAHVTFSFDRADGACLDQRAVERDPTEAQRVEIARRDQGCRFPGCPCRHVTDVHHMVWASRQGRTVLSNLLTLCVAHHSRVHELGWKLDGDAQGEVRFTSPQGRVVVSSPAPSWRPQRK